MPAIKTQYSDALENHVAVSKCKRTRVAYESDEDHDSISLTEESDSRSSKTDEGAPQEDDEDVSDSEEQRDAKRARLVGLLKEKKRLPKVPGQYDPGAVISVRMKDFVTYSYIEYRLGNSLNMIIGPNGTGKSTFVCALCLGLLGKPDMLGRAKELKDFVKNGCKEARIDIELQGHESDQRVIVTRKINLANSTTWLLNGRKATYKEVQRVIDGFNVQVDNLCQFLPQDKVASFAQSSPQDLLLGTERAIGTVNMVAQHEDLKRLGLKLNSESSINTGDIEKLEALKNKHREQEAQMEAIRDIERLEKEKKLLSNAIPFAELRQLNEQKDKLVQELRDVRQKIAAQKATNEAIIELGRKSGELKEKLDTQMDQETQKLKLIAQKIEEKVQKIDTTTDIIDESKTEITALLESKVNTQKLIAQIDTKLEQAKADFERLLNNPIDEQKDNQLKEEMVEVGRVSRRLQRAFDEASENLRGPKAQKNATQERIYQIEKQLERLNSADNQKLQAIRDKCGKAGNNTANAIEFLRQNKHLFKHQVFEPPIMSVNIKDKSCMAIIGSAISRQEMLTFTCRTREDYLTFTSKIIDEQRFNVTVVEYSGNQFQRPEDHRVPVPVNELKRLGFDGYILQLLEGPEPVLNMLCHKSYVHCNPYSKRVFPASQSQTISSKTLSNGNPMFGRYIHGNLSVSMSRSIYNERAITSRIEVINGVPAYLTGNTDVEQRSRLQQQMTEFRNAIEGFDGQMKPLMDEIKDLHGQLEALKVQEKKFKEEQKYFKEYHVKKGVARSKVEKFDKELKKQHAKIGTIIQDLQEKEPLLAEKLKLLGDSVEGGFKLLLEKQLQHEMRLAELVIESETRVHESREFERLSEFGLTELREEERRVKEEGNKIQNTIKELKKKLKKLSKEELEEINELTSDKTLNEIKADLNQIEARIETANTHGKDIDTIIQNFKRLEEDITTIEVRIENQTKEVESLTRKIYTIRSDWEPKLERLVSHVSREFSLAFEAIGCSGKVVLKKDDDNAGGNNNNFTNWAIQIMVSFRAGVEMQPLTGQRQSGGERAVSTILYLMALQELANSPFRVVDEINQGMDPSNERMVHNRMVEVACQTNTSQYFLITPKLLPNLTYDPRMRVSCIFSGPFVANINNHDLSSNSMVRNITALANN